MTVEKALHQPTQPEAMRHLLAAFGRIRYDSSAHVEVRLYADLFTARDVLASAVRAQQRREKAATHD